VMGVARNVLGAPRATVNNVNIDMNIPLDHELSVSLRNLPTQVNSEPNNFLVESWIDLGGEGVIPRPDVDIERRSAAEPFRVVALPAFLGTLADARMIVRATYGTGAFFSNPRSVVIQRGIASSDAMVSIDNWVGIPQIIEPMEGGRVPTNRTIRLDVSGNNPDFFYTMISQGPSSCSGGLYMNDVVWWQHYFPGNNRQVNVPNLASIAELADLPVGRYTLSMCGVRVSGFDFNNFRYDWTSRFYWNSYAIDSVSVTR